MFIFIFAPFMLGWAMKRIEFNEPEIVDILLFLQIEESENGVGES